MSSFLMRCCSSTTPSSRASGRGDLRGGAGEERHTGEWTRRVGGGEGARRAEGLRGCTRTKSTKAQSQLLQMIRLEVCNKTIMKTGPMRFYHMFSQTDGRQVRLIQIR